MDPIPTIPAAYVILETDQPGRPGPRPDLHHRPWQRAVRRRHRGHAPSGGRHRDSTGSGRSPPAYGVT
ncbi:hypothetical protein ACRAWD_13860 [Caulobacter segnis]